MIGVLILASLVINCLAVCPKFENVPHLNLSQYAGDWNIHGIVQNNHAHFLRLHCLHTHIINVNSKEEPITATVILHGEIEDEDDDFVRYYNVEIASAQNGTLAVNIDEDQWELAVLDTDYDNYSMAAFCKDNNDGEGSSDILIFFQSRRVSPIPENIIQGYQNLLGPLGMYKLPYYTIRQDETLCEEHEH